MLGQWFQFSLNRYRSGTPIRDREMACNMVDLPVPLSPSSTCQPAVGGRSSSKCLMDLICLRLILLMYIVFA